MEKYPARKEEMKNGVKVGLEEDIRWLRCNIKATSLLPNILSRNKAVRNGLSEIIWHRNGFITEGTQTNVCFIKDGELSIDLSKNDSIMYEVNSNLIIKNKAQKPIITSTAAKK